MPHQEQVAQAVQTQFFLLLHLRAVVLVVLVAEPTPQEVMAVLGVVGVQHLLAGRETLQSHHHHKEATEEHLLVLAHLIMGVAVVAVPAIQAVLQHLLLAVTAAQELHLLFLGHPSPMLAEEAVLHITAALLGQAVRVAEVMLAFRLQEPVAPLE